MQCSNLGRAIEDVAARHTNRPRHPITARNLATALCARFQLLRVSYELGRIGNRVMAANNQGRALSIRFEAFDDERDVVDAFRFHVQSTTTP